jgi:hypothetical protein
MLAALACDIAVDTCVPVRDHDAAISRSRGVTVGRHSPTIPSIGCEAAALPGVMLRYRFLLMTYRATIEPAALASAAVLR